MPDTKIVVIGTPRGESAIHDWFRECEAAKIFAKNIMTMPSIVSPRRPTDRSRHWDSKDWTSDVIVASDDLKLIDTPYTIKPGEIVFDEASKLDCDSADFDKFKHDLCEEWREVHEVNWPEVTSTSVGTMDESMTVETIKDAIAKLEDPRMVRKRRIPKKAKPKGDSRRVKYSARKFGNILLSTSKQIIENTTLNDALADDVLELIKPLFEEFFQSMGDKWMVNGPMNLHAQNAETGQWKNVSALGGEVLHFKEIEIGKRDGVLLRWETGSIVGMDDEMIIDTSIRKYGTKIVQAELKGNPANRTPLIDILLGHAGQADIVTAAEEAKEKVALAIVAAAKEEIERKTEAYGGGYGAWG